MDSFTETSRLIKCLYQYIKCSCSVMKKVSKKFHQGTKTMIIFFDEFVGIALKLETGGPIFSTFNSLTSLPSVAKED